MGEQNGNPGSVGLFECRLDEGCVDTLRQDDEVDLLIHGLFDTGGPLGGLALVRVLDPGGAVGFGDLLRFLVDGDVVRVLTVGGDREDRLAGDVLHRERLGLERELRVRLVQGELGAGVLDSGGDVGVRHVAATRSVTAARGETEDGREGERGDCGAAGKGMTHGFSWEMRSVPKKKRPRRCGDWLER